MKYPLYEYYFQKYNKKKKKNITVLIFFIKFKNGENMNFLFIFGMIFYLSKHGLILAPIMFTFPYKPVILIINKYINTRSLWTIL